MSFEVGERVVLKSFDRQRVAPPQARDDENYWRLVGSRGIVASKQRRFVVGNSGCKERLLIVFNEDITELGLACHNEQANSLWISIDDLEQLSTNFASDGPEID